MVTDDIGRQLHDRLTRGEVLSVDEKAQLEAWYAAHDSAEMRQLVLKDAPKSITELQAQVEAVLAQLAAVTKRIQEIAAENEALRREITVLRRQVPQLA